MHSLTDNKIYLLSDFFFSVRSPTATENLNCSWKQLIRLRMSFFMNFTEKPKKALTIKDLSERRSHKLKL